MQTLILSLYIIVCVLLVILILLQSGKEGMGVIFGGGNSSVFGSAGAGGILAKLTAFMAVVFVITALSYTYVTSSKPASESTILDVKIEDPGALAPTAPASPAPEAKSGAEAPQPADQAAPAPAARPEAAKPEPAQAARPIPAASAAEGKAEPAPAGQSAPGAEPPAASEGGEPAPATEGSKAPEAAKAAQAGSQ